MKTRSPLASYSYKGQDTKRTTVKWSVGALLNVKAPIHLIPKWSPLYYT